MKRHASEIFFPDMHGVEPEFVVAAPFPGRALSLRRAHYLTETGEPLLSAYQYRSLANLMRHDDPAMKNRMIVHNLVQVITIARRYTNRGLELSELVHAGTEGLIQALKTYRAMPGTDFSSFANVCVCQRINVAILDQKRPPKTFERTAARFGSTMQQPQGWVKRYERLAARSVR